MTVLTMCFIGNAKAYMICPCNLVRTVRILSLRVNSLEMFLNKKALIPVLPMKEE